jgi:hypothetical protein
MSERTPWTTAPRLQVVSRFVMPDVPEGWIDQLRGVGELLAAQPGCDAVIVGRATDDPSCWLLTSDWESVGAYRHALSSFDVKVHGVPVLSQAVDEPSAYEVLYSQRAGVIVEATSARADPQSDGRAADDLTREAVDEPG